MAASVLFTRMRAHLHTNIVRAQILHGEVIPPCSGAVQVPTLKELFTLRPKGALPHENFGKAS